MGQLIVRNLDDEVVARLKQKAASQNKSLEQMLRESLSDLARPSKDELVERARRIRGQGKSTSIDATDLIREDRDSR